MKRNVSRLFTILLALCMVLALLPGAVWAADSDFVIVSCAEANRMLGNTDYWEESASLVLIGYNGPGGAVTIPDGVGIINEKAFRNNKSVTGMTIPDSVTVIDNHAFENCTGLIGVIIPDSVTVLNTDAFSGCTSLADLTIGTGITVINDPFKNCTSLTSVTIPDSVTFLGSNAFYRCTGLTAVTIPPSVTTIASNAFYGCKNLTIYGAADSTAETFAKEQGIPFVADAAPGASGVPVTPADVSVTVNGKTVAWTDAEPFIDASSRTMVPLRAVADAMGLDVNWDGDSRVASFTGGGSTIFFPIDSGIAFTSDGKSIKMDTAAVIVNGRTYAPIRYLAEYFGYTVGWDAVTRTVTITG